MPHDSKRRAEQKIADSIQRAKDEEMDRLIDKAHKDNPYKRLGPRSSKDPDSDNELKSDKAKKMLRKRAYEKARASEKASDKAMSAKCKKNQSTDSNN